MCSPPATASFSTPARRMGLIDRADGERKIESTGTPLTGGFALYLALFILLCVTPRPQGSESDYWNSDEEPPADGVLSEV